MRKLLALVSAVPCLASITAFASILPPNDLWKEDCLACESASMSEKEFGSIIDSVTKFYAPVVKGHGATLSVNKLWTNPTVNASAQQDGSLWILNMYGGLARRSEVTADGFAMVVCHELGHHLGGFPTYGAGEWAASEGQSDYFATQACARLIWKNQPTQNAMFRDTVGSIEKSMCDRTWKSQGNRDLCYRTAAGGQSLATLLAALNTQPAPLPSTPDRTEVSRTQTSHPDAQCRLDTYLAGAVCGKAFPLNVIPTAVSDAACKVTGIRPRCWFAPGK